MPRVQSQPMPPFGESAVVRFRNQTQAVWTRTAYWTASDKKRILQFAARHQLTRRKDIISRVPELLQDLGVNTAGLPVAFEDVVAKRAETTLYYFVRDRLQYDGAIIRINARQGKHGDLVWQPYTRNWLQPDWNGYTKDPTTMLPSHADTDADVDGGMTAMQQPTMTEYQGLSEMQRVEQMDMKPDLTSWSNMELCSTSLSADWDMSFLCHRFSSLRLQ